MGLFDGQDLSGSRSSDAPKQEDDSLFGKLFNNAKDYLSLTANMPGGLLGMAGAAWQTGGNLQDIPAAGVTKALTAAGVDESTADTAGNIAGMLTGGGPKMLTAGAKTAVAGALEPAGKMFSPFEGTADELRRQAYQEAASATNASTEFNRQVPAFTGMSDEEKALRRRAMENLFPIIPQFADSMTRTAERSAQTGVAAATGNFSEIPYVGEFNRGTLPSAVVEDAANIGLLADLGAQGLSGSAMKASGAAEKAAAAGNVDAAARLAARGDILGRAAQATEQGAGVANAVAGAPIKMIAAPFRQPLRWAREIDAANQAIAEGAAPTAARDAAVASMVGDAPLSGPMDRAVVGFGQQHPRLATVFANQRLGNFVNNQAKQITERSYLNREGTARLGEDFNATIGPTKQLMGDGFTEAEQLAAGAFIGGDVPSLVKTIDMRLQAQPGAAEQVLARYGQTPESYGLVKQAIADPAVMDRVQQVVDLQRGRMDILQGERPPPPGANEPGMPYPEVGERGRRQGYGEARLPPDPDTPEGQAFFARRAEEIDTNGPMESAIQASLENPSRKVDGQYVVRDEFLRNQIDEGNAGMRLAQEAADKGDPNAPQLMATARSILDDAETALREDIWHQDPQSRLYYQGAEWLVNDTGRAVRYAEQQAIEAQQLAMNYARQGLNTEAAQAWADHKSFAAEHQALKQAFDDIQAELEATPPEFAPQGHLIGGPPLTEKPGTAPMIAGSTRKSTLTEVNQSARLRGEGVVADRTAAGQWVKFIDERGRQHRNAIINEEIQRLGVPVSQLSDDAATAAEIAANRDMVFVGWANEGGKTRLTRYKALDEAPEGAEVVAVPKYFFRAVEDVQRTLNVDPGSLAGKALTLYDTGVAGWKKFVLPLSPKWNVGNLIGNILMAASEPETFWPRNLKRALTDITETRGDPMRVRGAGFQQMEHGVYDTIRREAAQILEDGGGPPGWKESFSRFGAPGYEVNQFIDDFGHTLVYDARMQRGVRMKGEAERLYGEGKISEGWKNQRVAKAQELMESAVDNALKTMGDFQNLSFANRQILRRVMPFAPWYLHITRLAWRLPFENPYRAMWAMHLADLYRDPQRPEWLDGALTARPGTGLGALAGATTQDRYVKAPWNPFPGGAASPLLSPEAAAGSLSPPVQWGAAAMGLNLGRWRPMSRPQGEGVMDWLSPEQAMFYAGRQLPQTRAAGDMGILGPITSTGLFGPAGRALGAMDVPIVDGQAQRTYDTGEPVIIKGKTQPTSQTGGRFGAPFFQFLTGAAVEEPDQVAADKNQAKAEKKKAAQKKQYQRQLQRLGL